MFADFTVTEVNAVIGSVAAATVLVISAITAGFVTIRNSQKASDASNNKKLDEIHVQTNSNLTAVTEELAKSKKELADLKALVQGIIVLPPPAVAIPHDLPPLPPTPIVPFPTQPGA